jgi:hypothetical protein
MVDSLMVGRFSGVVVGMSSVMGSVIAQAKSSNAVLWDTMIGNMIESCLQAAMRNVWGIEVSSATLQWDLILYR